MELHGPTLQTYATAQVVKKASMGHVTNNVLQDKLFLQMKHVYYAPRTLAMYWHQEAANVLQSMQYGQAAQVYAAAHLTRRLLIIYVHA